jgi:hypothetical protein
VTDDSFEKKFDDDNDDNDFLSFIDKLADGNRKLRVRREIERREESNRIKDALGLDSFVLEESY